MSVNILHNSWDALYRLPFGALPMGASVRLRLWSEERLHSAYVRSWFEHRTEPEQRMPMECIGASNGGWLYEVSYELPMQSGLYWYMFLVSIHSTDYWYGNAPDHLGGAGQLTKLNVMPPSYQITIYDPAHSTPDWLTNGIMYQLMVDRFYSAGRKRSLRSGAVMHSNWDELPELYVQENGDNLANDFFGGNLEGVTAKLNYLQQLGVSVIYMNPIFESPSNHKYNISDYSKIDPMFGTDVDFKRLCTEASKRGMRIMLDGVFSHTGDDSLYFNHYGNYPGLGAYQGKKSPYYDWYTFNKFPDDYKSWWGFNTLPEVRKESKSYQQFIYGANNSIVRKYLRMGAAGWRLDVADELPMEFIAGIKSAALAEKPDSAILGEVWEDASNKEAYGKVRCYLTGSTLDSVMNYPLRDMILDFMLNIEPGLMFVRRYNSLRENYPTAAFYSLMNLLGSHDRPRILNLLAGMDANMPRLKQSSAAIDSYMLPLARKRLIAVWKFICALPGMPCIYYGDEVGAQGMGDPFCRATYPWGHEDAEILATYRAALALRKHNQVLRTGDVALYAPVPDVLVVQRSIVNGTDALGHSAANATALIMLNRSLVSVTVCLPISASELRTVELDPVSTRVDIIDVD